MRMTCPKHGKTEGRFDPVAIVCAECAREVLPVSPKATFVLVAEGVAIKCLRCGRISHNDADVQFKFCGVCGYHPPQPE